MGDAHAVAAGLEAGEITFGNLAAPGLVEAVSRGAALVFLAGGVNQQFLVGAPGRSLADVAGQPMGASSPGDLTDFLVQITMERVTEAESEVRYAGGSRARLRALLEGDIAASPLSPPLAVEAKHQGCAWLYDYAELGLNFAIGGIAASRRVVAAQPDLVDRFLRGYLAGQRHYQQDRAFGVSVQQRYGETSAAIAEETYDVTSAGFRPNARSRDGRHAPPGRLLEGQRQAPGGVPRRGRRGLGAGAGRVRRSRLDRLARASRPASYPFFGSISTRVWRGPRLS